MFRKGQKLISENYTDADYAGSQIAPSQEGIWRVRQVKSRMRLLSLVLKLNLELWHLGFLKSYGKVLKIILNDLEIIWEGPMKLYRDNKSAISIAHRPAQHDRTKHIVNIIQYTIIAQNRLRLKSILSKKNLIAVQFVLLLFLPVLNQLMYLLKGWLEQHFKVRRASLEWMISIYQLEGESDKYDTDL